MQVKTEKLDHFGRGIAYVNNKITFIENALPEEIIDIKIIKETKKYNVGIPTKYIKYSVSRQQEPCPYASICGGCQLEHMSLEMENNFKKQKVEELLEKFTPYKKDLVKDIIHKDLYHYRNKITLHGKNHQLGYYEKASYELIPIEQCLLANSKINELLPKIMEMSKKQKIEELVIRTSNDEKNSLVSITGTHLNDDPFQTDFDSITINNKNISKTKKIISEIGSKKYFISAESFFQVNQELTKDLYDQVLKTVKKSKPQTILDLYCGTGTIGLYISEEGNHIIGVDSSLSSIQDANQNKELNGVDNIEFIHAKVEDVIENFQEQIDCVIMDPPRAGLDPKTIENLHRIGAQELIYISCDPATMVRDITRLSEQYIPTMIQPLNMFPRTYHVECVCVLKLR